MKFSEFVYEHLDYEDLKQEYEKKLEALASSKNAEAFMEAFEQLNHFRGHIDTMQTLWSIRHSINTADEY